MLKNIPYYLEWEKLVKNEYSAKVFNAAKKKAIKEFSEYDVCPDNVIHWVPDFEKAILDKISEAETSFIDRITSDLIKKENEIYHTFQKTIKNEDGIDAVFQNAFDKWLEEYNEYCEAEPDSLKITDYIRNAYKAGRSKSFISEMTEYWIECIWDAAYKVI